MRTRSSTAKRLLRLIAGISAMAMCAAPSVFAANTEFLPTFAVETLTPASQANFAWKNVAPNALASYYTYQPLLAADAALAGFPAGCGDKASALPADQASTMDCYIITVKKLIQPMSLDFLNLPGVSAVSGANAFPGPGLIQADGLTPFVDQTSVTNLLNSATGMTTAWGYGSGGNNWQPFGASGPTLSRGNAPAAFATTPIGLMTGEAGVTGIWHFPAPTIKGKGTRDYLNPSLDPPRPVLVLWQNDLPNEKPVGHDPSIDCGEVADFCYPYNRIVTHVHGAHVTPDSDGLAVAWYNKNFALFGEGKFTGSYPIAGNLYSLGAGSGVPAGLVGAPLYYYPMTQEAGTIWYHDHAIGTTHNNTDMGMAGFFPVTDSVEIALQTPSGSPALPVLPTGAYELGFALQDRHFDVNGQMVMPSAAVYDKNDVNCVFDADNNAMPGSCARMGWMKQLGNPVLTAGQDPTPSVRLIPFNQTTLDAWKIGSAAQQADYARNFPTISPWTGLADTCKVNLTNTFEGIAGVDPVSGARVEFTQCAPFPAQSATLEYFGNMPVVNGVTYATYTVEPTVYRMRFIGGTDSRAWIAQLIKGNVQPSMVNCGGIDAVTGEAGAPAGCAVYPAAAVLPFYQVATEQGLLSAMVKRNDLDIMGGERIDVLVDFTGLASGTVVTMKNLGDDAPYSGRFDFENIDVRQPTSVEIPEIMKFVVKAPTTPVVSAKTPADGVLLRTAPVIPTPAVTRVIALIEITDQYGRTMPTVDGRGYVPPGIRTTEIMQQNVWEYWDIVNTTVDAHPMHIHQVPFMPIHRQAIALNPDGSAADSGFKAGFNNGLIYDVTEHDKTDAARVKYVFTPSQYIPVGNPIPVAPYEAGWKDTINTPPGYVVRNKIMFDILGDYVWHCHILSHEEHDMMRPFRVTNVAPMPAPASVTVGAVVTGTVTITIPPLASPPADTQYVVQYRKVGANFWETNDQKTATQTVDLVPAGLGTYEFRAQIIEPALQNVHVLTAPDSAWVPGSNVAVYGGTLELSPVGAIGNVPLPIYVWSDTGAGSTYDFYLTTATGTAILNTPNAAATCNGSTCSFTPARSLATGSYKWFVRSVGKTNWGAGLAFSVQLPVVPGLVTQVSPSGAGAPALPTYTWTAEANSTSYNFYLKNSVNSAVLNVAGVGTCVAGTCTYTPNKTLANDTFTWYVQGVSAAGAGPWGTGMVFSRP